ncbi:hypothetical protein C8A00DRAFT_29902 [Chaetomidium leptoderma]|uniref:Uncharacterized protein n=1 Tax=Chaetomidium leptoderma TaxID=669021 RepID=A0AAN7A1U6_9PEZI|nr:hypothetical protein C8A00DRAFT_29902 [Chaetomidium leptoderma]
MADGPALAKLIAALENNSAWKGAILRKIRGNSNLFPDEASKFGYAVSHIGGEAADFLEPYLDGDSMNAYLTVMNPLNKASTYPRGDSQSIDTSSSAILNPKSHPTPIYLQHHVTSYYAPASPAPSPPGAPQDNNQDKVHDNNVQEKAQEKAQAMKPPIASPRPTSTALFMRPTKASNARSKTEKIPERAAAAGKDNMNVSSLVTIDGDNFRYHDGKLITDNVSPSWHYKPRYLDSTEGSVARAAPTEAQKQARYEKWLKDRDDKLRKDQADQEAREKREVEEWQATVAAMPEPDGEWPVGVGLDDPPPPITPDVTPPPNWIYTEEALANCFQNHPMGLELARTAFELARESLWHYTREHHPELWMRLSRYGPTFIRASWKELGDSTKNWKLAPEIDGELNNLSILRNFLAHPTVQPDLDRYARYARHGVELMLTIGDEARLRKYWEARDALRAEAEKTLAEVEEREALAHLPGIFVDGGCVWETKHIDLFRRVCLHLVYDKDYAIPPVVLRAAERWGEMNGPEQARL